MCTIDGCGDKTDMPPIRVAEADRRAFLAGALSLPLATVLAYPEFARAQAAKLEPMEIDVGEGAKASGVVAMPDRTPAPAVVLIHEWWGLNDQIKAVAADLADLGYIAFAIDLYGGETAETPERARELSSSIDPKTARARLAAAIGELRTRDESNGKVGTVGWCFGGGWSLNAAMATKVDATVIYYGRLVQEAQPLERIAGPVLGHFGTQDDFIDEAMVGGFERAMAAAGKADLLTVNWYTADHAFANPTGARYDEEDAALAWSRTQTFFARHLAA